eukprot:TRINITY_DN7318_c2_g1_i1.p1 TRINITY_DN7318_c2_g1~~TRINITY_DN7318_c2_g1_i1.p1  ORF type:complete len:559 (+),score=121.85 TRINITY_DN7318_c2_g1_i1:85-1677(+)
MDQPGYKRVVAGDVEFMILIGSTGEEGVWKVKKDEKRNRPFYVNVGNGDKCWVLPPAGLEVKKSPPHKDSRQSTLHQTQARSPSRESTYDLSDDSSSEEVSAPRKKTPPEPVWIPLDNEDDIVQFQVDDTPELGYGQFKKPPLPSKSHPLTTLLSEAVNRSESRSLSPAATTQVSRSPLAAPVAVTNISDSQPSIGHNPYRVNQPVGSSLDVNASVGGGGGIGTSNPYIPHFVAEAQQFNQVANRPLTDGILSQPTVSLQGGQPNTLNNFNMKAIQQPVIDNGFTPTIQPQHNNYLGLGAGGLVLNNNNSSSSSNIQVGSNCAFNPAISISDCQPSTNEYIPSVVAEAQRFNQMSNSDDITRRHSSSTVVSDVSCNPAHDVVINELVSQIEELMQFQKDQCEVVNNLKAELAEVKRSKKATPSPPKRKGFRLAASAKMFEALPSPLIPAAASPPPSMEKLFGSESEKENASPQQQQQQQHQHHHSAPHNPGKRRLSASRLVASGYPRRVPSAPAPKPKKKVTKPVCKPFR